MSINKIITFFVVLLGWVVSLCLHEFSHALIAYRGGDTTVKDKGYLSFNPLKYTHPVYSILLPLLFLALGGIGLPGGAVYIETWRLRSRGWVSAVSLAGPASNLILGIVLGMVLAVTPLSGTVIGPAIAFLAFLQFWAVVLNLIPLPPFDGFGAIDPYLPQSIRSSVAQYGNIIPWAVFFMLWYIPAVYEVLLTIVALLARVAGVPLDLAQTGLDWFRFWLK